MIGRRELLALAIVAGILSGALYFLAVQRPAVVVVTHDIDPPRPLTAADLELRAASRELAGDDVLVTIDDAIGRTPIAPLLRGQLVLRRALSDGSPAFASGIGIPVGMRAIAIPVGAADALGGAVRPGARVDVVAVPVPGRAPPERATEVLASGALVLDVRSESGEPYVTRATVSVGVSERIGSLVLAVRPSDALWLADRVATSTFVIASAAP